MATTTRTRKPSTPRKRRSSRSSSSAHKPTWKDYVVTRRPVGTTKGQLAIRWIEAHCVFTNDRWTGRPFRLFAWQRWIVLALFTVGADGLRVVRWALIGIAKKNGKTELLAALALFFAFGPSGPDGEPEPSALVIVAAGSDEQADTLFGAAKKMAELSPTLSQVLEPFEDTILCPSLPGSMVKRVAAAAKRTSSTLDGKNIYVVVADELHCWEGPQARVVHDVLTNAFVTRLQPMVLQITTAGFDPETICGEHYDYGLAVAEGRVHDPSYFFWWCAPPDGVDYRDPAVIEAANPSFGHVMTLRFYEDQLSKKTEAVFRRYFLNQWTEAAETWLPFGAWEAMSIGDAFDLVDTEPTWQAVDAATKHDGTALATGQWHVCTPGCPGFLEGVDRPGVRKLRVTARIWERPLDPATRRPVEGWRLPVAEVENGISAAYNHFGEYYRSMGYDPAHFHRSADQLENEGVPVEDIPQSDTRMVPAAQALYQLVLEHKIEHDGNPDLVRHIRNAVAVQARGGNGGWRLAKGKAKRKMDGAVAVAMLALLATSDEPDEEGPDIW